MSRGVWGYQRGRPREESQEGFGYERGMSQMELGYNLAGCPVICDRWAVQYKKLGHEGFHEAPPCDGCAAMNYKAYLL